MKTNKYQWMKHLHLMTFVYLGILYLLIFVFLCRIFICILSVCHNYHIFFLLNPVSHMKTKERKIRSCFWLEFIMTMAILSCSSQWLTEAAFGRTLCICVCWPCICILALFFCSVKPYFIRKKCCIPWWIIIDPSMQHLCGYDHKQLLKLYRI